MPSSTTNTTTFEAEWTELQVQPDPNGGVPLARSSHGVSYLASKDMLLIYGGENVARTPLPPNQVFWVCRNVSSSNNAATTPSSSTTTTPPCPTWKQILLTTTGPTPRVAHAQAVVQDRYLYLFGGRSGINMEEQAMNDLWVLDTSPDDENDWTWTQVEQVSTTNTEEQHIPCPRSFHRMIAIGNDLYVFGGCGAQSRLNDLWKFNTITRTWHALGDSQHLRGRGGPNLVALDQGRRIAVVAGFAGHETNDGHCFSLQDGAWESQSLQGLGELRPRSVCCCTTLSGCAVIFGGEVDPSAKGHEGAGGFENDLVILDGVTGDVIQMINITATTIKDMSKWPTPRGWSGCDAAKSSDLCWIFGGLTGDDANPVRLGDLWRLKLVPKENK